MEFMIVWFPLVKLGFGLLFLVGLYYLFKHGWVKCGIIGVVLLFIYSIASPVKYNGAESESMKRLKTEITDVYFETALEEQPEPILTKKLSFDEQMAKQERESDARTAKLHKQLGLDN